MKTWAPLWSGIVDSSIWDEPDYVVKIFVTMLALKDMDHIVRLSAYQIGKRAKKDELEVLDALKILSSPDKRRKEKQEFDGRRIQLVEEGWLVLNGEKYREMVKLEMARSRNRKAQAAFRQRQKLEDPAYEAAKDTEYQKRRKTKAEIKLAGSKAGARQAIKDCFHDAQT